MTHEPIDDALKALRDELAAVSPSPEFQARVRQRIGGEIDLLREQLAAVAPSPEFAVRVRQGIEDAQAARAASWWRVSNWRWVASAAAAAAIVAMMVMLRPQTPAVEQVTAKVAPEPSGPVATQPATGAVPGQPQMTPVSPVVRGTSPRVAAVRTIASLAPAATTPADPFREVLTNQPAILRVARDRIRAAGAPAETPVVAMTETNPEIAVAPVEVSPIVVKWMVEPPPSPSGGAPVIRRVTADLAERSAK